MFEWLWLIPALPLAGFATLTLLGRRLGRRGAAIVGVGAGAAQGVAAEAATAASGLAPTCPPAGSP